MRFRWMFLLIPLLLPVTVLAATLFEGPLVSCTSAPFCQLCDLMKTLNNVIRFAVSFSVIVATLMFTYAGVLYFTASAKQDNIKKAHGIFTKVFMGLVLVLVAWLVIDIFMKTFLSGSFGPWNDIQCGRWPDSISLQASQLGLNNPNDVQFMDSGGPNGQMVNPPAGSCVAISQQLASTPGITATPNCTPGARYQTIQNGLNSSISQVNAAPSYAQAIQQCSSPAVPPSVLSTIAGMEHSGNIFDTPGHPACDPTNNCAATCIGGYGAMGVSCDEAKKYDPSLNGKSNEYIVNQLRNNQQLNFCAGAAAMQRLKNQYGDWGTAAAVYNGGSDAVAASQSCKGYLVYQCPVASDAKRFPWCNVSCAYRDNFMTSAFPNGGG